MKKIVIIALIAVTVCAAVVGILLAFKGNSAESPALSESVTEAEPVDTTSKAPDVIGDFESEPAAEGEVLYIMCDNEGFYELFKQHYPDYVETGNKTGTIGNVTVTFDNSTSSDYDYYAALDRALAEQSERPADERIDLFVFAVDNAAKYVCSDYTLPLSEIGITEQDTDAMYQYMKDLGASRDGTIRAVSWQACPGVFAYRRSVASKVLGTDDPEEVQKYVSDLGSFAETAALMKTHGYYMLSGYDDIYKLYRQQCTSPWVNENNEIVIDDSLLSWLEQSRSFAENGYSHDHMVWSEEWANDQRADGDVFGFFYSTWGLEYALLGNTGKDGIGDWAVCEGPLPYNWGEDMIAVGYGTDNPTLAADIIRTLMCDDDVMRGIAADSDEYVNNISVMSERAAADSGNELLGGQDPVKVLHENAVNIKVPPMTEYDEKLAWFFEKNFSVYISGEEDFDAALDKFYEEALQYYPELKRADTGA